MKRIYLLTFVSIVFAASANSQCDVPVSVTAHNTTSNTSSIKFDGGSGTSFIVEYGLSGFTPGVGASAGSGSSSVVTGAASPISITGLTNSASYDVYVRQVCTGPVYSDNSTVVNFTAACAPANIPYTEDFESLSAPAVPLCNSLEDINGNTTWTGFENTSASPSETATSGTKSIRYNFNNTVAADDWFFTRGLNLTGGTSYRLRFRYKASDGPLFTESIEVKYGNQSAASAMTLGSLFSNPNINNSLADPFLEAVVDFTPASSGEYYIGFHCNSAAAKAFLYLDDISVDLTPACPYPFGLSVGSIAATTASVSFSATGNNFVAEYGPPGFTPGTGGTPGAGGTIATGISSPIALSGLTASTTYDVYVRQVCSGPSYSANSISTTFTTACNALSVPYVENFDGVTFPALPSCTKKEDLNGGTGWTTQTTAPRSAPNALTYQFNEFVGGNDWFYTAPLNLTGGTSYRLRFWYRVAGETFPEGLEVKYGTDNNAAAMTNAAIFSNTALTNENYIQTIIDFTPSTTGVYYIGFHDISFANQFDLYIDDISVDLSPACPEPSAVTITATGPSSASVSFTSAGNNFVVEYGAPGFTPGTGATPGIGGTIVTGTASPIALTGLTGQLYDIYVRTVCGGSTYSDNTIVSTFLINDDAPGARVLTVGAGCTGATETNERSTKSIPEPFPSCSGTSVSPIWYKFTAPASGAVRISTDLDAGNTFDDSKIGLFSASNVNNYSTFSIISCDDDGGSANGFGFMSVVYATGLQAGQTYYVAVDRFSNSTPRGTFCISVDELNFNMLATSNDCSSLYQAPQSNGNSTYTGWQPLLDINSKLIALVRSQAGTDVSFYTVSQNINPGTVRTDITSGQKYLDRNFSINNPFATNVETQFFFLHTELQALQVADPGTTIGNLGVTRQTSSTCESDFTLATGTSSYLAQAGNGTSADGLVHWIRVSTPELSNFYLHTSKTPVTLKTFLQGAYDGALSRHKDVTTAWRDILRAQAINQPFNTVAYGNLGYNGTESVSPSIFTSTVATTDIVDWVLLELRSAPPPAAPIATRAAFILENGSIVDLDGVSSVTFRGIANGNYYITVRHRNHLGIRTATTQLLDGSLGSNPTPALYNFTTGQSQAFQDASIVTNAAMAQNGSNFLMWGGNANLDLFVRVTAQGIPPIPSDVSYMLGILLGGNPNTTLNGYSVGDMNMDGRTRVTALGIPPIPSDASFMLGIPLNGVPNATRKEHK